MFKSGTKLIESAVSQFTTAKKQLQEGVALLEVEKSDTETKIAILVNDVEVLGSKIERAKRLEAKIADFLS